MRRILSFVAVVVVGVGAASMNAQDRPNFSGNWVLVSTNPEGTAAFGAEFMIRHEAATLQISQSGYVIGGVSPGPRLTETRYPVKVTYTLDGIEHPTNLISEPPLPSTPPPSRAGVMTMRTEESISKATWAADELVIMQYNKSRTIAPGRTLDSVLTRQTIRKVLSLDSNGGLVVDRLIVADPSPWGHKAASPTPVRSIYRKN